MNTSQPNQPSLTLNEKEKANAIQSFIDILKFKTVSGSAPFDNSYNECAHWILNKLKIDCQLDMVEIIKESISNKPIVVGVWKGTQPEFPVIILNSHYDVVPVDEDKWNVPCFDGMIQNNKIYGRGTQDMKCVCIQYLVAIMKLKQSEYQPTRSIILTFVPDEEIGGYEGMHILLQSQFFKLYCSKVAIALDEGLASEDDDYSIFYGERLPWWIKFTATGNTGHGSRFIEGTAVEQIVGIAQKALAYREEQRQLLHSTDSSSSVSSSYSDNNNNSNSNNDNNNDSGTGISEYNNDGTNSNNNNTENTNNINSNNKRHDHSNCSHSIAAKRIKQNRKLMLGDVTTLNLTHLHAGVTAGGQDVINIVPSVAIAKCDIRVSPHVTPQSMIDMLDIWCQEVTRNTPGLPTAVLTAKASSSNTTTTAGSNNSEIDERTNTKSTINSAIANTDTVITNKSSGSAPKINSTASKPQSQQALIGGVTWEFIGNDLKQHQVTDISEDLSPPASIQVDGNITTPADINNSNNSSSNGNDNNKVVTTTTASIDPIKVENRYWLRLIQKTLLQQHQIQSNPSIFPAATDSRFLRAMGVRAFGISPIRRSEILLHEHNECLDLDIFIEGCHVYISLLTVLASTTVVIPDSAVVVENNAGGDILQS